jgi:hypothetical protein
MHQTSRHDDQSIKRSEFILISQSKSQRLEQQKEIPIFLSKENFGDIDQVIEVQTDPLNDTSLKN